MTKLILKPPHAVQLMTPAGEVLPVRADGGYDITAHPTLAAHHPDWELQKIEEDDPVPSAAPPKPRVLLRASSPAIHQIFASDGSRVTVDDDGFFDITHHPAQSRFLRAYGHWRIPAEAAK